MLATGGYGANTELLPDTLDGYKFYGRSTDLGDGLQMAVAIGKDSMTAMMNSWAIGSGRIGGEHSAENALADQKAD